MPTETVSVEWIGDQVFLMNDRAGFPIVMTQPMGVNGADLLPLSVIGCAVWDVVAILNKQHQEIQGLKVTAESVRDDEPPWRFRKIRIHYRFAGRDLSRREDPARHRLEPDQVLCHLCHPERCARAYQRF